MGEWHGREVELDATNIAHGGISVARLDGRVVFVSDAIPGERVVARITDDDKAAVWRADTVRVLEPSIHRRPHPWAEAALERDPAQRAGGAAAATVHFAADITDAEIDAYIATGEPLEVAGAFTIDSKGAGFITGVDGDPHAVVGLSVPLVRTLVRQLGIEWTDLWNR